MGEIIEPFGTHTHTVHTIKQRNKCRHLKKGAKSGPQKGSGGNGDTRKSVIWSQKLDQLFCVLRYNDKGLSLY
jgi:hypothetical protein